MKFNMYINYTNINKIIHQNIFPNNINKRDLKVQNNSKRSINQIFPENKKIF